jgi:GntR family transcriptional regulator
MPPASDVRPLERSSSVPLWKQLEAELRRRLAAGAFDTGVPVEHELAATYEVSRHTVREALRRMRAAGELASVRGRGTSVSRPAIEQPLGTLYSLFRSVESSGVEQRSQVRALDVRAAAPVAKRLGCPARTRFIYLERLRLAAGDPLAVDRVWILKSLAAPLLDGEFEHSGLYDELARLTGVRLTGGREVIRAAVPDADVRRALAIRVGVAVLAIERIGCVQGRPVEFRETLIRGDRFAMSAEWPGGVGYQVDATGLAPEA